MTTRDARQQRDEGMGRVDIKRRNALVDGIVATQPDLRRHDVLAWALFESRMRRWGGADVGFMDVLEERAKSLGVEFADEVQS
jgi:hypothetical protein